MSISSDVDITRQEALEIVFEKLMYKQSELVKKAVNAMTNDELANELHTDLYFYHVSGKGKLKEDWED